MKKTFPVFLVVIACIGISAAKDKWKSNAFYFLNVPYYSSILEGCLHYNQK